MAEVAELKYYLVKRAITFIPTLIGLTLLVFVISHVVPADPARLWAGGLRARPEVVEAIRQRYHLNEPLHVQYWYYVSDLAKGDWGISPETHRPVFADLATYFPATLELAIVSMILVILVGIPLGIISAIKRDTWIDHVVRIFALSGISLPVFGLALILQWVFYYALGILPASGRGIPRE